MRPLHFETGCFVVVGQIFFASDGGEIRYKEVTSIAIALRIVGFGRKSPRTFGVEFSQEFQIHFVAQRKIVSSIAEIKSARGFVTIGGHDDARRILFVEGEEAVGDGNGKGHIGYNKICGAEEGFFAWGDFGACELEIKVGMISIASGVLRIF